MIMVSKGCLQKSLNKKQVKQIESIKRETIELLFQIKDAEETYAAYQTLNSAFMTFPDELHIAHDFFMVVYYTLINSVMISTIKIYDRSKDAYSIRRLINKCLSTNYLCFDSERKTEYDNLMEKLLDYQSFLGTSNQLIDNLIRRRNKHYMHNDHEYFLSPGKLIADAPLSFSDITKLLSEASSICKYIFEYIDGQKWTSASYLRYEVEHNHEEEHDRKEEYVYEGEYVHTRAFAGLEKLLTIVRTAEKK